MPPLTTLPTPTSNQSMKMLLPVCALVISASWSMTVPAAGQDPEQLMRETTERVITQLEASPNLRKDPPALKTLIEKEVFPHVDFPYTARMTLGRAWTDANPSQREKFTKEMQKLLACTYSTAFASYSGQEIEYQQASWDEKNNEVEIRSRITQDGKPPLPVNYRLHKTDASWKIYDLVVEGVSLVANYRSTFRQQLQNQDLDGLITDLAARSGQDCKTES